MKRRGLFGMMAAVLVMAAGCGDNGTGLSDTKPQVVPEAQYTTTASGLQYYDFVVGSGAMPTQGDVISVHYEGWLLNGTKFDSSRDRDRPLTVAIGVGDLIAGWDEGVITMRVGGQRQLRIPSSLAYGPQGTSSIPGNATLIFEVELLSIGN